MDHAEGTPCKERGISAQVTKAACVRGWTAESIAAEAVAHFCVMVGGIPDSWGKLRHSGGPGAKKNDHGG